MYWHFLQLLLVLIAISVSSALISRSRLFMTSADSTKLSVPKGKVWPGNRPPVPNPLLIEQKMDATWGRGKFRTEVWEDDVNPWNFWWEAYAPSEETLEAMELGFDFTNPKEWLEVITFPTFLYLIYFTLVFINKIFNYCNVESRYQLRTGYGRY